MFFQVRIWIILNIFGLLWNKPLSGTKKSNKTSVDVERQIIMSCAAYPTWEVNAVSCISVEVQFQSSDEAVLGKSHLKHMMKA